MALESAPSTDQQATCHHAQKADDFYQRYVKIGVSIIAADKQSCEKPCGNTQENEIDRRSNTNTRKGSR